MKLTKKQKKTIAIALSIFLAGFLIFDLSPLGGNIAFYKKWAECGHKPLEGAMGYFNPIKWYQEPATFALLRTNDLFCTPLEAEQAGYSASEHSIERPHLDEYKKQQQLQ